MRNENGNNHRAAMIRNIIQLVMIYSKTSAQITETNS